MAVVVVVVAPLLLLFEERFAFARDKQREGRKAAGKKKEKRKGCVTTRSEERVEKRSKEEEVVPLSHFQFSSSFHRELKREGLSPSDSTSLRSLHQDYLPSPPYRGVASVSPAAAERVDAGLGRQRVSRGEELNLSLSLDR